MRETVFQPERTVLASEVPFVAFTPLVSVMVKRRRYFAFKMPVVVMM